MILATKPCEDQAVGDVWTEFWDGCLAYLGFWDLESLRVAARCDADPLPSQDMRVLLPISMGRTSANRSCGLWPAM